MPKSRGARAARAPAPPPVARAPPKNLAPVSGGIAVVAPRRQTEAALKATAEANRKLQELIDRQAQHPLEKPHTAAGGRAKKHKKNAQQQQQQQQQQQRNMPAPASSSSPALARPRGKQGARKHTQARNVLAPVATVGGSATARAAPGLARDSRIATDPPASRQPQSKPGQREQADARGGGDGKPLTARARPQQEHQSASTDAAAATKPTSAGAVEGGGCGGAGSGSGGGSAAAAAPAASEFMRTTVAALQNAKISSSLLWSRLSLGRRSSADIAREKHTVATKLQAVARSTKERLRFKETLRMKVEADAREHKRQSEAAGVLQRAYRTRRARYRLRETMLIVFERRQDPRTGADFYFNRRTGESQWDAPLLAKQLVAGGDISKRVLTPRSSATRIQAAFRKSRVRGRIRELVETLYDRVYDSNTGHCYYLNKVTGEARWQKPLLLKDGDDLEYKPQRRPGVEEYLTTQQKVVSQLWDNEALAAAKLIYGKPVRFMRLSLQQMRADSTAVVAGDMGEVVDGGTETDSVVVMTEQAVKGAVPVTVQRALNPLRFRVRTSYAPKRAYGKADRGNWEDQQEFFAYYKAQPTTTEYSVYWKRNDPATSCALFRVARGAKLADWQWSKIFSFHAYGVVPIHVFESGNRTRGTLLFTGTYAPEPPDEQWAYQFTCYGLEKALPGTTVVNVQTKNLNDNPRNTYCRMTTMRAGTDGWEQQFSFYAFQSPMPGTRRLHQYFAPNPDRSLLSFDIEHPPWRHRQSLFVFF